MTGLLASVVRYQGDMVNLQDYIGNSRMFKKFKVDDLLFTEFKCPLDDPGYIWWHNNFFTYVVTGETLLQTPQNKYVLRAGDCAFAKKGSVITHSRSHEDFCELIVFVPNHFIRTVTLKYAIPMLLVSNEKTDTVILLSIDNTLTTYFYSLLAYFELPKPPTESLLKLKFEELLVNILSNNNQLTLKRCLGEICASSRPSVKEIMEANFSSNLSLNEFARLCARSVSAFKQEFKSIFNMSPGRWLLSKRLEYGRYLLGTTDSSLDEICSASGFENTSHFIRVFKEKFGITPHKFKLKENNHPQESQNNRLAYFFNSSAITYPTGQP